MSETRARANRLAFAFGSLARKGLIGGRAGVALLAPAGALVPGATGAGDAAWAGLDAAGVGRTTGVGIGGVAGRAGGTGLVPAPGVAKGGTAADALGGVNGRGGNPPNGGRPGTGAAAPDGPAGRGAKGAKGAPWVPGRGG